ncbi:MAG TPA: Ppx/GppA phosphatase family protein, partial [Gemmatimonadales bacterium]|nr:Ppx/GppA phosphatase family protein [Gemmatimonadales bacterium]
PTETPGPVPPTERPRLAAIDIGTNSIRLIVAEVEPDGTYRVLDEEQEMSRLGRGLYRTGRLGHVPMERALEALGKMKAIADGFAVRDLRAIATSAVREATNGRLFCREAWRRHRLRVEVISAEEEAQLAFQSVQRHFGLEGQSTAVVDIGGGSAEVILALGGVVERIHSLPLGAVRLTERWVRSDPLKARHWKALRRAIDDTIKSVVGKKPPFTAEVMIGSGGTFSNLAQMARSAREGEPGPIQGYVLTRGDVIRLLDRLRETPLGARRQIPGVNPKRADILVAGAAAVVRLAKWLGTQRVVVNEGGLRDGVLLSMMQEHAGAAAKAAGETLDRMERVRVFARRCRSNERHCAHVAELALSLFDQLQDLYRLPAEARDLLWAATLLHDIGYLINHAKHHKHAYHLIMHGELAGFAGREVELIANVARYHRRALPKRSHENLARLDRDDQRLVRQLAGMLRVADGLDRTHTAAVSGIRCQVSGRRARVEVLATRSPRVELWDAERKAGLFEKAFGVSLRLEWTKPGRGVAAAPAAPPDRSMPARAPTPLSVVAGGKG